MTSINVLSTPKESLDKTAHHIRDKWGTPYANNLCNLKNNSMRLQSDNCIRMVETAKMLEYYGCGIELRDSITHQKYYTK